MTGYLHRASIARSVKAAILSRPPHAGFRSVVPVFSEAAFAPPPGDVRVADGTEAELDGSP